MGDHKPIDVSIDQLHFDPKNPRLPDSMEKSDDKQVLEWMLKKGDLIELMESIGTNGYSSAEPLLTTLKEDCSDNYEVIEGNRRLAALKLLQNPELAMILSTSVKEVADKAKADVKTVPIIIYKKREDVLSYLGYRHITGVKSWGALAKVRYLKDLLKTYESSDIDDEEKINLISKTIATKPYWAKKSLATLKLIDDAKDKAYWGLENFSEEDINFSVLSTAVGYSEIAKFLGWENPQDWNYKNLDEDSAKDLFEWLFVEGQRGKKVPESRKLKTLAHVVSEEQALRAFRSGRSLDEAALYSSEADENFRAFLLKINDLMEQLHQQASRMRAPSIDDSDILREVINKARMIKAYLDTSLSDEN